MNSDQLVTPSSDYDFIFNPTTQPKRPLGGKWIKDPFIAKLVVIIGGAGLLVLVFVIAINLFFAGKTDLNDLVVITQSEQEIVRLSAEGENADSQLVKNAAINTALSINSQQKSWFTFLKKYGRTVIPEELDLKRDLKTDEQLAAAKKASDYDAVYAKIMRAQLTNYSTLLSNAYKKAGNKQERELLNSHHQQVYLLLEQWPR